VDGSKLYSGMENALYQDGPASDTVNSSPSRISEFDAYTGKPLREFVYVVAPVPDAPVPATSFATNGLVEL
jgi:3-phytase